MVLSKGANQFLNTSNESYVVPEGQPRIAQCFSVGFGPSGEQVPKGRLKCEATFQPSLRDSARLRLQPNAEALGYSHNVPPGQNPTEFPKGLVPKAILPDTVSEGWVKPL